MIVVIAFDIVEKYRVFGNKHIPKNTYAIRTIMMTVKNCNTLVNEARIRSNISTSLFCLLKILKTVIHENKHPRPISIISSLSKIRFRDPIINETFERHPIITSYSKSIK